MSKFKSFLISITPLIVVSTIGLIIFVSTNPFLKIKSITKNLKIIDANKDHNQALDVIEYAQKKGVEIPKTLINFDTHSDIYVFEEVKSDFGAEISNWINELFANYPEVEELYWVMPTEEAKNREMQELFIEEDDMGTALYGNSRKNPYDVNPKIHKYPYTQYFLVDTKTGYIKEYLEDDSKGFIIKEPKNPKYKKFKVITCTEKTLPDFKNKKVILSIDFDYISNSGYDTTGDFVNDRTQLGIKYYYTKLLTTIQKRNIRPEIISLTLSPVYVPQEDENQLYNIMQMFVKYSGKKDILTEYTRQLESPQKLKNEPKYKSF